MGRCQEESSKNTPSRDDSLVITGWCFQVALDALRKEHAPILIMPADMSESKALYFFIILKTQKRRTWSSSNPMFSVLF